MAKKLILINQTNGLVEQIISPFADSSYETASYTGYIPYVVDSSFFPVTTREVVYKIDGTTQSVSLSISPVTEQKLTGTVYGSFKTNELVFQTPLTPTVVTNYAPGGIVDLAYAPVVVSGICTSTASIVGGKCVQFKGSYLDTDTQASCIKVSDYTYPGVSLPYYMVSGFLYLSQTPAGAYDPIIVAKTASGTAGSVNDSFLLEYDNSAQRMQLQLSSASYSSAGYEYTLNASPVGVSLNNWHHFAFAYSNAGGSASVSTYWDGNRITKQTGLSGNIRMTNAPFSFGGGPFGDKPLKGYLDDVIISGGTVSTALRGLAHGTTCTIPTESQSSGNYTILHSTFHGPDGTSYFPMSVPVKNVSSVMYSNVDPDTVIANVYVGGIDAISTSAHGLSAYTYGTYAGHTLSGVSAGNVFGYESGACLVVSSVTQLMQSIDGLKTIKSNISDNTLSYLLGSSPMQAITGSSADFPKLYATGFNFAGKTFTFLPTKQNIEDMRTVYDGIVLSGKTAGTYNITGVDGATFALTISGFTSMYADVTNYFGVAFQDTLSVKSTIQGTSTFTALRQIDGLTRGSFVQKLSALVSSNVSPPLAIKPTSKTTKTYVAPELILTVDEGIPKGLE